MKLALVHLATRPTALETLEAAWPLLEQAQQQQAQLIVLPELFASGYQLEQAEFTPLVLKRLQQFADRSGIHLLAGLLEAAPPRHANRAFLFSPQQPQQVYTKIHLIPAFHEPQLMEPGQQLLNLPLLGFQAAVAICYDLRFPELFRLYAAQGANLFLLPSAWPAARAGAWELLARARAAENQAFMAAVNHAEAPFGAASLLIDPLGEVLVRLEAEGVAVASIDPQTTHLLRQQFPVLGERRLEIEGTRLAPQRLG